jgi:methyl-accepting chemotaxis protein
MKNRRRRFFIDKPLQSRYASYIALTLLIVCGASLISLYYGIWGSVIESFSDEKILQEIKVAARIQDYEQTREPMVPDAKPSSLRLFNEIDLLSARQREILEEILMRANIKLLPQFFLLIIFIGLGSIYLTHKIAGPLFRIQKSLDSVKNGELNTRIYLRKYDEAMSVANSFNDALKTLDASVSNLKKTVRESGSEELRSKLESELSKFKTTDF